MKRLIIITTIFSFFFLTSVASAQFLIEAFTNIACNNCKFPDEQLEAYIASKSQYKAQIVYIHTAFPSSFDPFYKASKADVDLRSGPTFYKIPSDPEAFINGIQAGTSFSEWRPLADETASAINYPGSLTATSTVDGAGMLQVDLHAEGSSGGKQVKPYVMVIESGIKYDNTDVYGNPKSGVWDNVFRAMIPKSDGDDAFTLTGTKDFHYTYSTTGKPWVLTNCKIVAFLQEVNAQSDNVSHKIDAFTTALITSNGVAESNSSASSILAPIPNPSHSIAQIPFHVAGPVAVKVIICDDLGREVATAFNGFVSGSQGFATFIPGVNSHGIYYARMYADGAFIGMQKIVFAP
jgi:hypothetical protein